MRSAICTSFTLAVLFFTALAGAQTLILESESGTDLAQPCDYFHRPFTCAEVHYEGELSPTVGSSIQLDGRKYLLEWMGPGYYLESGVVLQPLGDTAPGLRGQRWLEIYPHEGRVHTSRAWKDGDENRALSVSDTLALDSDSAVRVIDVRLQLRVKPAPPKP
ncbi:MAG TPA: hypothetical protein VGX68_06050 [Thermoanaerobaculia bacterium]|jgi:hypothetical protein|nr:hypothetical protein [Thermoanaerobaculia bacterium]